MPKNNVSIALCTYNGSDFLEKQIASILSQTYPIDEIVIVDDCSKDNTRQILEAYANNDNRFKLHYNTENMGSNKSFRKAIALTSNDLIALCDQDDIWNPEKLDAQIKMLAEESLIGTKKPCVIFHDLTLMDTHENIVQDSFWKLHGFNASTFEFRSLFLFNIVTGCTCLINSAMKEAVLKSDMKNIMMHDYLIALIAYGFGEARFIDRPLMLYRSHDTSVTVKEKNTINDRLVSFLKRIRNRSYLLPNILQMEAYLSLYEPMLEDVVRNDIIDFVALKKASTWRRFWFRWFKTYSH